MSMGEENYHQKWLLNLKKFYVFLSVKQIEIIKQKKDIEKRLVRHVHVSGTAFSVKFQQFEPTLADFTCVQYCLF